MYLQITCLGTIGGENVQECTRRIMKFIMTHAVSLQYTWKGSAEKRAFENTAVCNAVKCKLQLKTFIYINMNIFSCILIKFTY